MAAQKGNGRNAGHAAPAIDETNNAPDFIANTSFNKAFPVCCNAARAAAKFDPNQGTSFSGGVPHA